MKTLLKFVISVVFLIIVFWLIIAKPSLAATITQDELDAANKDSSLPKTVTDLYNWAQNDPEKFFGINMKNLLIKCGTGSNNTLTGDVDETTMYMWNCINRHANNGSGNQDIFEVKNVIDIYPDRTATIGAYRRTIHDLSYSSGDDTTKKAIYRLETMAYFAKNYNKQFSIGGMTTDGSDMLVLYYWNNNTKSLLDDRRGAEKFSVWYPATDQDGYTSATGDDFWYAANAKAREGTSDNKKVRIIILRCQYGQDRIIFSSMEAEERGNLKIVKKDADSGKKLQGVGFILQYKNGRYVHVNSKTGEINYVTSRANATEYYTDKNGEINIKGLLTGEYKIIETKNPNSYYEEVSNTLKAKVTVKKDVTVNVELKNKRKYVDLTGFVWEDRGDGKEYIRNDIYDENSEDKRVQNVKVTLIDSTTNKIVNSAQTDKNGAYKFTKVNIDKLKDYYIEFEYNGLSYSNVKNGVGTWHASKAEEGSNRTTFNEKYLTIEKQGAIAKNGNVTTLEYDSANYQSNLIYGNDTDLKYGYTGAEYPIYGVYNKYLITSSTTNAYGGNLDLIKIGGKNVIDYIRDNNKEVVEDINLGLYEREQPDVALVKDLQNIKLEFVGVGSVYKYGQKLDSINKDEQNAKDTDTYQNDYRIGVKFKEKYSDMSYTRPIYESDYNYEAPNEEDNLKAKLTYKISLKNQSTNLTSKINSIVDYFDNNYTMLGYGTDIDQEGNIINMQTQQAEEYDNNYQKAIISLDYEIAAQQERYIYIQFELNNEAIKKVVNDGENLENIAEITSYSTFKEGEIYAGIDVDSRPESAVPSDTTTFEDDTDRAPGIKLVLQDNRMASGKVFEDSTEETLKTGEERQGNGRLDDNESGIKDVEVVLKDENGNIAKVYDNSSKQWVEARTKTNENGEYFIDGFIPGRYTVEFMWGDENYKVQNYKSTVVNKDSYEAKGTNDEWYKDEFKQNYQGVEWENGKEVRVSDAVDNYELREQIDAQTQVITYETHKQITDSYSEEEAKEDIGIITKMTSSTPIFKVNFEYASSETDMDQYEKDENGLIKIENGYAVKKEEYKNHMKNIDFGIVKRAKQILKLDKRLKSVKMNLSNGLALVDASINEDGTIEDNPKYITYIKESANEPQLKIEMDNELAKGSKLKATYELKVTNISELDYKSKDYYLYGKGYEDKNNETKLTPSMLIDYLDNNMLLEENERWVIKDNNEKSNLITDGLLSNEVEDTLNNTNTVITTETLNQNDLTSGRYASIEVSATRVISSIGDEDMRENNAEIIKVEKTWGAGLETIPGNYVPGDSTTYEEDDDRAEGLNIVPATGLTVNYIAYIILAISSLGILVIGIVIIKKFVLK